MNHFLSRRDFLIKTGISAAAANFLMGVPGLGWAAEQEVARKKRVVFVFSPNGVIPDHFWPDEEGPNFTLKRILEPLADFKNRMLTLHGVCNRIKGQGTCCRGNDAEGLRLCR